MNILQAFIEALESLSANKLRSALTILGIVIGVAAVIAMISIGRGEEGTITGSIEGIGTNLIFVFRGGSEEVRNPEPITLGDAEALSDPFQAPAVADVAPMLQDSVTITADEERTSTELAGVTPSYESVRNSKVSEGEFITEELSAGFAALWANVVQWGVAVVATLGGAWLVAVLALLGRALSPWPERGD